MRIINYAHRGASEYAPENTLSSFYLGLLQGANGIETDVQRTKDGELVLFHDDTVDRVSDGFGKVSDYTLQELRNLKISGNSTKGYYDRIVTLREFLEKFSEYDISFAIELKGAGVEEDTADMIRKYGIQKKCVVTSFKLDYIRKLKAYAPELEIGYLTKDTSDELLESLKQIGCEEYCPKANLVTAEDVQKWHNAGFRVRAWGVSNEELMRAVYDSGADGMTVNFPDKLVAYMQAQ